MIETNHNVTHSHIDLIRNLVRFEYIVSSNHKRILVLFGLLLIEQPSDLIQVLTLFGTLTQTALLCVMKFL